MKTIDIRTTQNVTIEYEVASVLERGVAIVLDTLIIILINVLIFFLGGFEGIGGDLMFYLRLLLSFGGFMLYQLVSEIFGDGQSWGKKLMGIKVVRLDGRAPGLTDYLLRAIFHFVDTIFSFGVIALLMISSSAKKQRLGDMAANTTVIKVKQNLRFRLEDILNINSIEDYEPQYPEVKALSEQDMLLIKHIISRNRLYRNKAHQEAVDDLVHQLSERLHILDKPQNKIAFLKTLIRDYIVLTR